MAITSQTSLDLVGQTSTLSYYQGASLIDQITFGSNAITYQAISSFNLVQTDMLLYYKFLNTYLALLYTNFPIVPASANLILPNSQFEFNQFSLGLTHIQFIQASLGNTFISINYLPSITSGSYNSRASPVTITLQEFIQGFNSSTMFYNQILLN